MPGLRWSATLAGLAVIVAIAAVVLIGLAITL
jgi:hypothetical protein